MQHYIALIPVCAFICTNMQSKYFKVRVFLSLTDQGHNKLAVFLPVHALRNEGPEDVRRSASNLSLISSSLLGRI